MRIVSWNVNSLKPRHDRFFRFLEHWQPDVVCLQETKSLVEDLPKEAIESAGWHLAAVGQKTYNGVALVSKTPIEVVSEGLENFEDPQARFILGETGGIRIASAYIPNGKEVGSDKHEYKLKWLAALRSHLDRLEDPQSDLAILGDWNCAPRDTDAKNIEKWRDSVLCHESVREAIQHVRDFGLIDPHETIETEGGVFTLWDYRSLGFPKNDGLRIDHALLSASLNCRVTHVQVDREERKAHAELEIGKPSDHAPLIVDLED